MTNSSGNRQGFTLIEMMVVVTIIAVLAGLAGYTYYTQIQQMRLNGDVRQVDQALQQAKLYAVSRGEPAGVIFRRVGGDDRTAPPDEMYIFVDSTGDGLYTDDDDPCRGCKVNPEPSPGASQDIPTRCTSTDTFPDCTDPAYTNAHDQIVDGPLTLETGIYFTRIFGAPDPASPPYNGAVQHEFVLFNPLGGVNRPPIPLLAEDRRIHLQNHPDQQDQVLAGQVAVELNFTTGVTRIIPLGAAPKDDWK